MIKINENRNFGIDILRSISMTMIVLLHVLGHGGILKTLVTGSFAYYILWFFETLSYIGVNIYALITGYFGYKRHYIFTDIIIMWLRVMMCDVFARLLVKLFFWNDIGFSKVLKGLFPLMTTEYWYFSAYFLLFLFMPLLNIIVNNIPKTKFKIVLGMILLTVSFFSIVNDDDIFRLHSGLSAFWIIIIYLLGAYLGRFEISVPKYKSFILFLLPIIITYVYKILNEVYNTNLNDMALHRYVSPTIICASTGLFLLFKDYKVKCNIIKKYLTATSPLIFSIYLIHDNTLFRRYFILDKFIYLTSKNQVVMFFYSVLIVVIIYFFGIIIDYFREKLFTKTKIKQRIFSIECKIRRKYNI